MKKGLILSEAEGFTLIEVIIILAIISLLFGGSIAYYNQYTDQKKLDAQVQKLDDVLHLFQKKAVAGEISGSCNSFNGYQMRFSGDNQYAGYICCDATCSVGSLINSYTLESPVTISYSKTPLYFKALTGNLDGNENITINVANSTKCQQIKVETSGLISLINPCP